MRTALRVLSIVAAFCLIGPAANAQVGGAELLPPGPIISFEPQGTAGALTPFSSVGQPIVPSSTAGDETNGGGEEPGCNVLGHDERYFAEKVNRSRRRHDRKAVNLDTQISAVAAAHSRAMKRQAELYHTGEQRLRDRVTRWVLLGENVGRGMGPDSLHQAFMESPDHRRTVIDERFHHVGIGIARDDEQIWITVLFETRQDPGTTMRLPKGC